MAYGEFAKIYDELINEDINYELIGQMVDIFVRNGFTYFDTACHNFLNIIYNRYLVF